MSAPQNDQSLWPSLEPGQLRHRVTVQEPSQIQDEFNQIDTSWTPVYQAWASIRTLTQRELAQSQDLASEVTHEITMRFPCGVLLNAQMRVVRGSHIYKIQALSNVDERNVVLVLQALEINESE